MVGIEILSIWWIALLALAAAGSWWGFMALDKHVDKCAPKLIPPHVQFTMVAIYLLAVACSAAVVASLISML